MGGWTDGWVNGWMDGWTGLLYPLHGLLQDADPILITFTSLALRTVPESHNCSINVRGKDAEKGWIHNIGPHNYLRPGKSHGHLGTQRPTMFS